MLNARPRAGLRAAHFAIALLAAWIAASPSTSAQLPSRQALTCEAGATAPASVSTSAALELDRSGYATVRSGTSTFAVVGEPANDDSPMIARIAVSVDGGSPEVQACGPVRSGFTYQLPPPPTHGRAVATITLIDEPRVRESERADAVARERVVALLNDQVLAIGDRNLHEVVVEHLTVGRLRDAKAVVRRAIDRATDADTDWRCPNARQEWDAGLHRVLCHHLARIETRLVTLERALAAAAVQPPVAEGAAPARLPPVEEEPELELDSPAEEEPEPDSAAAEEEEESELEPDSPAVAALEGWGTGAMTAAGAEATLHLYLASGSATGRLHVVARFEVPLVRTGERLVVDALRSGEQEHHGYRGGDRLAVLVTDVPNDVTVSAQIDRGAAVNPDPAALVARFIPLAARAVGLSFRGGARQAPSFLMDLAQEPLAHRRTVAFWPGEVIAGHRTVLHICRGRRSTEPLQCITQGEAANVASTHELVPEPRWSLRVLVAAGAFTWIPSQWASRVRFERDLEAQQGPDAIYALRESGDPVLPNAAALIGFRFDDTFIGVGPSFAVIGSDPLRHWNLMLGLRAPSLSRHLYLLAGVGVLVVDMPNGVRIGERVAVPIPAMGDPTPPAVPTHQTVLLTAGIAIGIDLEGIGAAGGELLKALGVTL